MSWRFEGPEIPVALTIAGSDSSGGAGIQADLKTFSSLGVYGMSVVTAITAQNSLGVHSITELAAPVVAAQLAAVLDDIPPRAIKIGMLATETNVRTVAAHLRRHRASAVVLDPVLTASSGASLLSEAGAERIRVELLPLSALVTPNLDEAEFLAGMGVRTPAQMEEAAKKIHRMGARHVLITGGHLDGNRLVDLFFDGNDALRLVGDRIPCRDAHGTGCVLSAAVAANLARGFDILSAVSRAHVFTRQAISKGLRLGQGAGPCDPVGIDPV